MCLLVALQASVTNDRCTYSCITQAEKLLEACCSILPQHIPLNMPFLFSMVTQDERHGPSLLHIYRKSEVCYFRGWTWLKAGAHISSQHCHVLT